MANSFCVIPVPSVSFSETTNLLLHTYSYDGTISNIRPETTGESQEDYFSREPDWVWAGKKLVIYIQYKIRYALFNLRMGQSSIQSLETEKTTICNLLINEHRCGC